MRHRISLAMAMSIGVIATACGSSATTSPTTTPIVTTTTTVPSTGATTPRSSPATLATSAPTSATVSPASSAPATAPTTAAAPPPATSGGGAVDPNAPEVVEPGDIPDNQVFVAFQSPDGIYSVTVPEGWARSETGGVVMFTDKYNSVTISSTASTSVVSVDDVKNNGLTDVSSDPTFRLVDVQPITRKAGDGVLATYEIGSAANPVTGKKALLAVERYVFDHNGTTVVLTLSGAKGADNVDPWKVVSNSLTWND
ncbi:MAG: hypothetical protein JWN62_1837 [Acidimicrobiales bacterium]|nr:hypothetical protein [Acidimicrobiales bacterium]